MTLILGFAAIFALVYAIGLRARTAVLHQALAEERFADQVAGIDVPLDGPPIVVIPMQQKWRCPDCGDEMHPKFEHSHALLCKLLADLMQADVDQLMDEVEEL